MLDTPPMRISLAIAAAVLLSLPSLALAQQGAITGTVVDQSTARPLSGAQVFIAGTEIGTLTEQDGSFRLEGVSTGTVELRASLIGYRDASRQVEVAAGQATQVEFRLAEQALQLQEIVVTGTAGQSRRSEQPAQVSDIQASDLVESSPINNVSDLLQGRSPGVSISQVTGQSGAGERIRIRGFSSISLSNRPLIYIDGIRVDGRNQLARPDNTSAASPATSFDATGGQGVSRLNDLDPENIERVEIVKGPAAATLYGADASSGVIQIFTKEGSEGEFQQSVRLEATAIEKGFDPLSNWATCTEGSDAFLCEGKQAGTVVSDNPLKRTNTFQTGRRLSADWSGRGGGEDYGFFASVGISDEESTVEINTYDKKQARLNFNWRPGASLGLDANYGLSRVGTNLPMSNHSPLGIPTTSYLGSALSYDGSPESGWGFTGGGKEALFQIRNFNRTMRNTVSLTARQTPADWFNHRLTVGGDFTRTEHTQFFPRNDEGWYFGDMDRGYVDENRKSLETLTFDYLGTFSADLPSEAWTSSLSLGVQWVDRRQEFVVGTGVGLTSNEARSVSAAAENTGSEYYQRNKSLGYLAQYQLSFRERLHIQLGARVDQNSSFGDEVPRFFLPKAGVSYVLSNEEFWEDAFPWIDQLRLRAAYGETGNAPQGGSALRTYGPARYVDPATGQVEPGVTLANPGNPDLRAEKGREWEAGFDLSVFDNRAGATVTWFHKTSDDLILERPLASSRGFSEDPFDNIGSVVNSGLEVSLNGAVVQSDPLTWRLNAGMSMLSNELTDLGDLEPFGGSSAHFEEGQPLASVYAREILRIDTEADKVIVSAEDRVLGDYLPDFEGHLASTLNLFSGNVTLRGQADWRTGFLVDNATQGIRDDFRNSRSANEPSYPSEREHLRRFGPYETPDGEPVAQGLLEPNMDEGDFIRLREVSAGFNLPASLVASLPAVSSLRLRVAARNLKLWTGYDGVDPEAVASGGLVEFQKYSFFTLPPDRRFSTTLRVQF